MRVNLLGQATVAGTTHQISDAQLKLATPWHRSILSFGSPSRTISKDYGGMEQSGDTSITLKPSWTGSVIPPESFELIMELGLDVAESGDRLFDGTAYEQSLKSSEVKYKLYGPDYDQEYAKNDVFNTSLIDFFTAAATTLGLIPDTSLARDPSPMLSHTMTRDALVTDVLALVLSFYSHHGWIDRKAGKMFLIAMESDNGSRVVDRRFFAPELKRPAAVAKVLAKSSSGDTWSRTSDLAFGKEITLQPFHSTQVNIETELDRILSLANQRRGSVTLPMGDGLPAPGERITAVDNKYTSPVEIWVRAREFTPDFTQRTITISGEGGATEL